ncbi:MAG: SDR family NAD(P)-dependent oxidoreductase [Bacilli bacterium]|nr:SDR family NAD(P)-dependent oxidoreductase [Bacilli bacterium]MDD3121718.1 SDR family NAD(P)-dependent oxidoreductase [Bacilli bacterium]MDD4063534.1 SDR family NAD(P)-dependent oxidoreductase [Bacilli bacterium]MDD4482463.1 SDR family NAD(P)-dependent oxidoreductase [Bacilli bacterium]
MKVIVITGATSGIGGVTANYLAERGNVVYSLSRTIRENNSIKYLACDVTIKNQVIEAINKIIDSEGRIDVIINNAGMGISGALEFNSTKEINHIIDVNINGIVNMVQVSLPFLRKTKGKIINIGSVASIIPIPFQSFYSITKSGVLKLSETLAMEVKPFGIKVSCVLPGDTKTEFTKNRKKEVLGDDIYQNRINRSVSKMEKDELNGMDPIRVTKVIEKIINRKNPKVIKAVGFNYKVLLFLYKILPSRVAFWVLYKLYAK